MAIPGFTFFNIALVWAQHAFACIAWQGFPVACLLEDSCIFSSGKCLSGIKHTGQGKYAHAKIKTFLEKYSTGNR
jgi:hypothetical protein